MMFIYELKALIRKALNYTWSDFVSNEVWYKGIKKASEKIRGRRMRLAGHVYRHPESIACFPLLWSPKHGKRSPGRPRKNFIDQLKQDTGIIKSSELGNVMNDRKAWKTYQKGVN